VASGLLISNAGNTLSTPLQTCPNQTIAYFPTLLEMSMADNYCTAVSKLKCNRGSKNEPRKL